MSGVSERDLKKLRGFPAGVNNVAPEQDLPVDDNGVVIALREAVNVDLIGPSKKPRRRGGYLRVVEGRFHSPAELRGAGRLFAVKDGSLTAYASDLSQIGVVRADIGPRYLSYAEVNSDLYWSNGAEFRRIRGSDLADTPGWIDCPGIPNVSPIAGGNMQPGTYQVAMTWFDEDERESGASGIAIVDVPDGYGIRVHDIPVAPEGAVKARIYVSACNGDELYAATDLLTSVSNTVLGAGAGEGGKALETLWLRPLPPCETLRFWNGRLIGASRNLLVWSEPLRFGLTGNDNYMRNGAAIPLLEPVGEGTDGAGVWISDHKRTYWMAGGNPKNWRRVIKYDHDAVPGTSLIVKGTDIGLETTDFVAFWLSRNGVFCAGLPGGELITLTEGRLALPEGEQGASLFREVNGFRQVLTSYLSRGGNGLAIRDRASATVTRHP